MGCKKCNDDPVKLKRELNKVKSQLERARVENRRLRNIMDENIAFPRFFALDDLPTSDVMSDLPELRLVSIAEVVASLESNRWQVMGRVLQDNGVKFRYFVTDSHHLREPEAQAAILNAMHRRVHEDMRRLIDAANSEEETGQTPHDHEAVG